MKRILIATFFGLVAGGICATMSFYGGLLKFTVVTLLWILLNRVVMGFSIGVSGLKLHWAWNGVAIGIATGSIFAYWLFMNTGGVLPYINFFANGVFGLMIEFFTSVVFKQPAPSRQLVVEGKVAAHA